MDGGGISIGTIYGIMTMEDLGFSSTLQVGINHVQSFSRVVDSTMQSAQAALANARASIASGLKNIGMELGNIAAGAVSLQGALGGIAVGRLIDDFLDATGKLSDFNEQTGISVRDLQRLSYAGSLAGVGIEQIASGIGQFQNRIAEGNQDAVAALQRIGLSVESIRAMEPGQQFEAIAAGIATIKDPAVRTSTAMDLMGRSGASMLPLLRSDVKGLGDEAERLGAVMSDNVVSGGDAMGDAWTKLKAIGSGLVAQALTPIAQMFNRLPTEMERAHTWLQTLHLDMTQARADVQDLSRWWDTLTGKMTALPTVKAPASVTDIFKGGIVAPELPKGDELKAYYDEMARGLEVQKKAFAVADQHTASIRRLREELSGQGAIKAAKDMLEALAGTIPIQNMTRDAQDKVNAVMGEARDAYKALGETAPKAITDTYNATWDLKRALDALKVRNGIDDIKGLGTAFRANLMPAIVPLIPVTNGLTREFDHLFSKTKPEMPPLIKDTDNWRHSLGQVAEVLRDVARDSSGLFGHIVGDVANIAAAWDQASRAASTYHKELVDAARDGREVNQDTLRNSKIAGAAAIYQATSSGSFGSRVIGGAVTGSAFGPVGLGAGAALGVIQGGIQAMQDTKARMAAQAEFARQLRAQIDQQYGSLANLQTAGSQFGYSIHERGLATPSSVRDIDAVNAAMVRLDDAMGRYNIRIEDLGEAMRGLKMNEIARDLMGSVKALQDSGATRETIAHGMASDLNGFIEQSLRAGTKIPAALQPIIETLIRTGDLTDANRRAMLGLADTGGPSLNDITEAAGRYGISLDALGPKVAQLRVDDWAKQLMDDWTVLSGLGGDTNAILAGMAPKVQGLADAARIAGSEIPAGMRPMMQQMVDLGLLTGDNKQKLTDLGMFKFAKPLEQSVDELVSKLGELIEKLTGPAGVTSALGQLARGVTVPVKVTYDYGMPEPPEALGRPNPAEYHAIGGYVGNVIPFPGRPRGTDTVPVWATPGELVVNAPQQDRLEAALNGVAARVNTQATTQTIIIEQDGRVTARQVARNMPSVLRVRGIR